MIFSEFFVKRPVATTILMAALVIFGLYAYQRLPINELPNVDFPTIVITGSLPGADPETMASTVATPIEKQLSTIAGIDSMSSVSSSGTTQITLQFALSRSIDAAAQDVQAAISQAAKQLPAAMPTPPSLRKVNPAASPILYIALSAEHLPLSTLDEYAETILAQKISMINGVAEVDVYGSQQYAVRIRINPQALAARGLGFENLSVLIQNVNANQPSGLLKTLSNYHLLKIDGQLNNAAEFSNQVISTVGNSPVRLKDVGNVIDSVANDRIASSLNGKRAIVLAIQRQPGANTVAVAQKVLQLLPGFVKQLPGGVKLQVINDSSVFIKAAIHDVDFTLILAVILVVLVMYLFLNNLSSTIITTLSLPISIIATFSIMYLLEYSLDNLSLMGLVLAVGFVIDDAVVVLENIVRHIETGLDRFSATIIGIREIGFTVLSMTLSLVAVFIPILFMGGILGRLFHEFAVVVSSAILFSGLIALTLTPMLCSRFLSTKNTEQTKHTFQRWFEKTRVSYEKYLRIALNHEKIILLSMLVIMFLTVGLYMWVPKGFIPPEDTGVIFISTQVKQGTSFPDFLARQGEVAKLIKQNVNVDSVMSTVGQGPGGSGGSINGIIFVRLKDFSQRSLTADEIIVQLRLKVNKIAGITLALQNPPAIRLGGLSSSGNYQYVLQSTDWKSLQSSSQKLFKEMKKIPGIEDVDTDLKLNNPELHLHILRDQAALLGITPLQIENALYTAYGTYQASTILTQTDQYQVIVEVDPKHQTQISDLNKIYLRATSGTMVPLNAVVEIDTGVGPLSVSHYSQLPAVSLSFNLASGVSLGDINEQVMTAAQKVVPQSITGAFVGTAKTFSESMSSLPMLLLFTVLVIYMILAVLYEHFLHPLTILTALPFAGFGALAVLILFNQELDIFSFIGIIMLVGLVKKNGIMMVDFAVELQRTQKLDAKAAILQACLARYRPIMMTTMAAVLATLPIAIGLGAGGESRRSMGIAVVGGLMFSQILTLFVTPVFFVTIDKLAKKFKKS